ncbi:MAG: HNH endonuclease [Chloroflexi bacterium]|nr:HNH endonuclease [Chloroflexota bacterium]
MTQKSTKPLSRQVRERARHRCEYCLASEWLTGQSHEVDHIFPRINGGQTILENLALACSACNGYKHDKVEAIDPVSNQSVALYNPREQRWPDHFAWSEDALSIVGLTACGRATIYVLRMNRPLAMAARSIWVMVKRHPPKT